MERHAYFDGLTGLLVLV